MYVIEVEFEGAAWFGWWDALMGQRVPVLVKDRADARRFATRTAAESTAGAVPAAYDPTVVRLEG